MLLLVSFSYRLWSFRLASSNNGPVSDSRAPLIILCLLASIPAVITTVSVPSAHLRYGKIVTKQHEAHAPN